MIELLYFSDRAVRQKVFEKVNAGPPLLLVTAVREEKGDAPVASREPFAALERLCGSRLHQLVVARVHPAGGVEGGPLEVHRDVVLGADDAFDRSSMRIIKRMAMIGSKEVMSNSLVVEPIDRKPLPHPLTVSCLKMMWSSITPHIDAIEVIVEDLDACSPASWLFHRPRS